MCQLLGKYALWMEHRDDAPPLTRISSWEDFIIIGNRKNTIRIYQRLKRHLMELLNLEYPGAFEPKAETIDGKKSIYIEPLINIAPLPKTSDGEPHKDLTVGSNMKFRGGVADFNLVEDFKKDKKLGLDEGVYHGFSDSDIVDNKEK